MYDFGVKHFSRDDANHLLNYLKKHYVVSTDWEGRNYLGLTIYWNYSKEYVDISMPDYVREALYRLQYPKPKRPQYVRHCWLVSAYGKILQMAPDPDENDLLEKRATNIIHSILGKILYHAWSVDTTMLREINEIS